MTSGVILVVDDNRLSRQKMALSVKALGYDWVEAEGGQEALDLLVTRDFDLVLLDIVMPEMDGFEVLARMRKDGSRLDTPVLVISGLDEDMTSVARAIELGAEDFLPKSFDPVLFRARVAACVEKKRLRAVELDYLRQVDLLNRAAGVMERGKFHPDTLGLEGVAQRRDALGQLAAVFMEMARQVYDRERILQRNIRTQRGGIILLLTGLLWGLVVPLSALIYDEIPKAVGVSFWMNVIAGVMCCGWAVSRGKSLRVSRGAWGFIVQWALLYGASSVLLFEAAGRVSGIMLSIVMALQGFAVFLIAAAIRIEEPTFRRFLGLGLGLLGVVALVIVRNNEPGMNDGIWIIVAIAVPILYGLADILIALRNPPDLDATVASGLVLFLSGLIVLPLALVQGQFFVFGAGMTAGDGLILLAAVAVAICSVLYIYLISMAGAVFGSQSAYATTVAGIGWSVLLLGDELTPWTVLAFLLVVAGLVLVGPKSEAEDVEVEFVRRSKWNVRSEKSDPDSR